jgi:Tol biopolymer transport system component
MKDQVWRAACAVVVGTLSACGAESAPAVADVEFVPPRDTDILLADIDWSADGPRIGAPTNLTQRVDYDNQPHFVPDGSGLWYTANDAQSGQSDIWRYDFASGMVARVTSSAPESEYSATPLPDGSGISTIRVEADSVQRLWRFDGDGSNAEVIMPDVAPVGYHTWADENTLVMFVLGSPATLQRGDIRTGQAQIVAENIGRSIWTIPGTQDVSFMQQDEDGEFAIMRLPSGDGAPELIIQGIPGAQYHAWAPDGTLFTASEHLVYARAPEAGAMWQLVGDFMDLHVTLSRLAVSPDGSQIALVAEVAALENFPGN